MHCLWIQCRRCRNQNEQAFIDKLHLLTRCSSCKLPSDCCMCQFTYCLQAVITSKIVVFVSDRLSDCPTYLHTGFLVNKFPMLIKSGSNWSSMLCLLINLQLNIFYCFCYHYQIFCLLWLFFYILYIAFVPRLKLSSRSVYFISSLWFRMKELKDVHIICPFFVLHSSQFDFRYPGQVKL